MLKDRTQEYLRYQFNDTETLALARELGQSNQKLAAAEETKKRVTASITSEIQEHKSEISRVSRLINCGYEYRNVECAIQYDMPEDGLKRIVRLDTGEEVRIERMTDADRQADLPLDSAVAGAGA